MRCLKLSVWILRIFGFGGFHIGADWVYHFDGCTIKRYCLKCGESERLRAMTLKDRKTLRKVELRNLEKVKLP